MKISLSRIKQVTILFTAVTLSVALLYSSMITTASAEGFSLRNGIEFGMTVDEIKTLEKANNSPPPSSSTDHTKALYYVNLTIAGVPSSIIHYFFNDGRLSRIVYIFRHSTDRGAHANVEDLYKVDYQAINPTLVEKYGQPINTLANGSYYKIQSADLAEILMLLKVSKELINKSARMILCDEWLVQYDDYNVKIEHYIANVTGMRHAISYEFFSQKELDKLQKERKTDL